jgi:hypothetical protein
MQSTTAMNSANIEYYGPEAPPPFPPRPEHQESLQTSSLSQRKSLTLGEDFSSPIHYTRDPHKLIGYIVPFPKPNVPNAASIPDRFLIYTPPPPPLKAPKEGEPESKRHKLQRKWQQEVRNAKTSDAKVASWKGIRSRATKGISYAMGWTTTSGLDFINRIPGEKASKKDSVDKHVEDGYLEDDQTRRTVGLEELVLVYPSAIPGDEAQIRQEFVNSMLRTKSKAQRDAVIATGLLPVSWGIDMLAMFIWPFGGLLEVSRP